jgi:hypothetical protein
MSWLEHVFRKRQEIGGVGFLRASLALLGFGTLLGLICFLLTFPALADGGEPLPTITPLPTSILLAPSQLEAPATPAATGEVNTFEIIIDSNQNATVQPLSPEGQAAISGLRDSNPQNTTAAREDEFTSPLWVFGFLAFVIFILVINSVARGLRSRA